MNEKLTRRDFLVRSTMLGGFYVAGGGAGYTLGIVFSEPDVFKNEEEKSYFRNSELGGFSISAIGSLLALAGLSEWRKPHPIEQQDISEEANKET